MALLNEAANILLFFGITKNMFPTLSSFFIVRMIWLLWDYLEVP